MGHNYSTVQLKLVVKTKFPFISLSFPPPVSHKIPLEEFLWNSFLSFSPFFPDVGEIYFTVCAFCFTIGETQLTNFPAILQNFPPISPRILPKFTNFPQIHPEFPRNSPIFPEFPTNFPMILTVSSWFLGSFLCSFHFTNVAYSVSEH